MHAVNLDGKGYAFAYDDVQPDGGADQSGKVNAGDPTTFIVAVGGNNAYTGDRMPPPPGKTNQSAGPPVPTATKPPAGSAQASHDGANDDPQQTTAQPQPAPAPAHVSRLKRISAKAQKWLQR